MLPEEVSDTNTYIPVLAVGDKVCYNVPSFPVFDVMLRHIKFQYTDEEKEIHIYDGFMRDVPSLDQIKCPALAEVPKGCPNGFFIDVSS